MELSGNEIRFDQISSSISVIHSNFQTAAAARHERQCSKETYGKLIHINNITQHNGCVCLFIPE